jgi:chaperonin GroES
MALRCSALNFSTAIVLYVRHPKLMYKGQAVACPRAARKTGTYRSLRSFQLAAVVLSAGTISLQVELRSARVPSATVSVGPAPACGARSPYRKAEGVVNPSSARDKDRTVFITRSGQYRAAPPESASHQSKHWSILMKFRPLHDRVVVERIDAEAKSAGGIIIPDTAKEKPSEGEIISIGPGGRDEAGKITPIDLKVGDRVLFGKWSGTEVTIERVEYLIMKESDILGVIEQTQARKQAA